MITADEARTQSEKAKNPNISEIARRLCTVLIEEIENEINEASEEGADSIIWQYRVMRMYNRTLAVWDVVSADIIDTLTKNGYEVLCPKPTTLIISWGQDQVASTKGHPPNRKENMFVVVWKDGSYRFSRHPYEYENDPDWLTTVDITNPEESLTKQSEADARLEQQEEAPPST